MTIKINSNTNSIEVNDVPVAIPTGGGSIVTTNDTGTVATDMIANSAIHTVKLADGNITASKLDGEQSGSAPVFGVRAWANFSGSTLNAGGNVTSITEHQTGDYSINFTTAMPDTNFSVAGLARYDGNTQYPYDKNEDTIAIAKGRPDSTGSIRIVTVKLITNPPEYHSASSVRVIVIA